MTEWSINWGQGLTEQLVFEEFFEDVQSSTADFTLESSRGWVCDTEGSVAKGEQFGVGDGEQTWVWGPQLSGWSEWEEVS